MRKFLFLIIINCFLGSCSEPSNYKTPVVNAASITKDLPSWLFYNARFVKWSADYVAIDKSKKVLSKEDFFTKLMTGKYLPLLIKTRDSSLCYQLHKLPENIDDEIPEVIKSQAEMQYQFFKMEGVALPEMEFVDLEQNIYNKESIKGRTLILNCWFIQCSPCVAEMPELNKLVKQYENKNVLFLGLAFDKPKELRSFLQKTKFDYKIVPNMEDYLLKVLKINGYPTHLIVNGDGVIEKVISGTNVNDFIEVLNKKMVL